MNKNNVKTNEKYLIPSLPILSPIISAINSYDISNNDCPLVGMIEAFLNPKNIKIKIKKTVTNIAKEEFVKDISKPYASNGHIVLISNCFRGLAKVSFLYKQILF